MEYNIFDIREVISNIFYEGGQSVFEEYKRMRFWEKYTGTEMNASCLYVMLFDNNLKNYKEFIEVESAKFIPPETPIEEDMDKED